MVKGSCGRALSTRASSSRAAVLEAPSLAPTNRNSLNSLVSKWLASTMRSARRPGMVAIRLTILIGPIGVVAVHACSTALMPMAASVLVMYSRFLRLPAEPDGRGPIATCWRRCSHALELSNAAGACAETVSDSSTPPIANCTNRVTNSPIRQLPDNQPTGNRSFGNAPIGSPSGCTPASWRPRRAAWGARSSFPGRAASLPTARPSPPCGQSRTAPRTSPPGSPSPGR